jgi:uncharacterized protein with ParB-like and HNH nuclease domain
MATPNQNSKNTIGDLQDQLNKERRLVSFDSYDLSVRQLVDMFESNDIDIPPEYQRQFIWDDARQSLLIESVFLGIPVPSLFMATNNDSTWEIVDGVQRLGTLAHFLGSDALLKKIKKKSPLTINGLEKLPALNGLTYNDLPKSVQLMFYTRPMRVTVLNDKSDLSVRFDLFERLNTGGISLTNQEIRNCVFRGKFNDVLKELTTNCDFASVLRLKPSDQKNGAPEEFTLRFFAFFEKYAEFDHSVKGFLNEYMKENSFKTPTERLQTSFKDTFKFLNANLPKGIVRGERAITPVNLYEAITVGTALAMKKNKKISPAKLRALLNDDELRKFTVGGTNSRRMVVGRIEYVAKALS